MSKREPLTFSLCLAFVKNSWDFRQRFYLYFQCFLLTICEIRIMQAFLPKNSQFIIMCILHNSTHSPQQSQRVTSGLPVFSHSTPGNACTSASVYRRQNYPFFNKQLVPLQWEAWVFFHLLCCTLIICPRMHFLINQYF